MAAYGSYGLEESAQDGELEERVERHFLHKTGCNARWERWVEECGAAAAAAVRGGGAWLACRERACRRAAQWQRRHGCVRRRCMAGLPCGELCVALGGGLVKDVIANARRRRPVTALQVRTL